MVRRCTDASPVQMAELAVFGQRRNVGVGSAWVKPGLLVQWPPSGSVLCGHAGRRCCDLSRARSNVNPSSQLRWWIDRLLTVIRRAGVGMYLCRDTVVTQCKGTGSIASMRTDLGSWPIACRRGVRRRACVLLCILGDTVVGQWGQFWGGQRELKTERRLQVGHVLARELCERCDGVQTGADKGDEGRTANAAARSSQQAAWQSSHVLSAGSETAARRQRETAATRGWRWAGEWTDGTGLGCPATAALNATYGMGDGGESNCRRVCGSATTG